MKKTISTLVFSILAAVAMLSQYIPEPKFDSDILWSVAIGKWITVHQSFPAADSFSWTINGKEWMTHEWIYCVLASNLSDAFGSLGLYILTLVPMILTTFILYLVAREYDENRSFAFIIAFTIGIVLLYLLALPFRAYNYALSFTVLLIYLLYFKTEKPYDVAWYILLFILWANFQVSVFIGLAILLAEMVRKFILYPLKRSRVFAITAFSFLATLVNPYGYKLWTYFIFVNTKMAEHRYISEWQAADFNEPWVLFIYLGVAASVILLQFNHVRKTAVGPVDNFDLPENWESKRKNNLSTMWAGFIEWMKAFLTRENCLIIGFWLFYIYALYSVRMFVFSLILWIIIVSYFVGKSKRFNFSAKSYYIFVFLFVVMTLANIATAEFKLKDIFTADNKISPVEEVSFLTANPEYAHHLFNDYIFGGYLILNEIPVFIDARCDSYIQFGVLDKYLDISHLKVDPQLELDQLGVENVFIADGPLRRYLDISPKWRLVYGGPTAFIYTRTDN